MKDLIIDNGDLKVKGNDLQVGEATLQVVENIVDSNKGEWKENKYLGVGIKNYLAANENIDDLRAEVIENMKRIGVEYKSVEIEDGEIVIKVE